MMDCDPEREFDYRDYLNAKRLARLPVCKRCGDPIDQEDAVCIGEDWYCDNCLDDMRIPTDDD